MIKDNWHIKCKYSERHSRIQLKKGKSPKDVFVKAKQQLQWPHGMSHEVCLLIATGIFSNITYINKLQNKPKLGYFLLVYTKFVIF